MVAFEHSRVLASARVPPLLSILFFFLQEDETLTPKVQKKRGEPWPSIEGDPALQEQYQVVF